ncbi:Lysylphosphatidylglycerol biosynthesis bifunctional protein LysX [Mycobacterium talmoniae]|uniref:Lysylphosphatidylglycerol biosynthesis bifunctional protein LysX n=1 Tax=Mycobacterium talmoniae TaxID=1858794 RepID=A0A2S8BPG1_9MYCO|nr:Lysylphosphatidylglycerol biosynthesis bifunctional protein LysX [Mycobacterium talmoniae]
MYESSVDVAPRVRARERVVVHVDSPAARWIGALSLLSAAGWMILVITRDHENWQAAGRLGWSLTILAAVALIARGIFLGRPVTAAHASAAVLMLVAGLTAHVVYFDLLGDVLIAGSGLALMWPTGARPRPDDLPRVWELIKAPAPIRWRRSPCRRSSVSTSAPTAPPRWPTGPGSGTRWSAATRSVTRPGSPNWSPTSPRCAIGRAGGWWWLGCSERRLGLWSDPVLLGQSLRAVPIGRDVVIDVANFAMVGRKFRNLRQAVQRTRNFGVTTEVVAEQDLDQALLAELTEVLLASPSGARTERGFCMALDGALEGRYPGIQLIIARDAAGQIQGFHRYGIAGGGSDVSLDVPWRRRGAPNGIDERLSVDMINAAKEAGAQRLSLAFAAFPELFDTKQRSRLQGFFYLAIHLLDPLIALESLYRYLRKFHSSGDRRYALVSLTQLVPLLYVLLSLEFLPRRRRL